jgi:hypothetical protein
MTETITTIHVCCKQIIKADSSSFCCYVGETLQMHWSTLRSNYRNESYTDRYPGRQRGVHIEMDGLHYLGDEA